MCEFTSLCLSYCTTVLECKFTASAFCVRVNIECMLHRNVVGGRECMTPGYVSKVNENYQEKCKADYWFFLFVLCYVTLYGI